MTDFLQVVELDQRLDVELPKQKGRGAIQTVSANRIEGILPASTRYSGRPMQRVPRKTAIEDD
jgi:hypothetical protein